MKRSRAHLGLISSAALLVPAAVVADSASLAGAPDAAITATAHVDFRIVIPPYLSLQTNANGQFVILRAATGRPIVQQGSCAPGPVRPAGMNSSTLPGQSAAAVHRVCTAVAP